MHPFMNMIVIAGLTAALLSPTRFKETTAVSSDARPYTAPVTVQPSVAQLAGTDSLLLYFDETTKALEAQVQGLSEAQLQFKPAPDKWSISQCLEHIILSEGMLFGMAKTELAKAPQPEKRNEVKVSDTDLKSMLTNRSQKFQAPKELQPSGKYTDVQKALADFRTARQPILDFIKQADAEDLRNHITEYPTGTVDGYQGLMFIAAHGARHTKQIEEIKASPNFPKK